MDSLMVEQANPVTGAYERLTFRPVVRNAGWPVGEGGVLLALTEATEGGLLVIADAFGRRTQAQALGKIERLAKVVICDFVEAK